jgi:hypothetical protein
LGGDALTVTVFIRPSPATIAVQAMSNQQDVTQQADKQLLHLVFGGELTKLDSSVFKDLDKLDMVGIYPNYASAYSAWKAKAQQTVDNAQMRYFIVHLHRLLDPEHDTPQGSARA